MGKFHNEGNPGHKQRNTIQEMEKMINCLAQRRIVQIQCDIDFVVRQSTMLLLLLL